MTANNDELRECREAFDAYWSERSWNVERIDNPSGYVEYKNRDLHRIWMGWQAALAHASSATAKENLTVGASSEECSVDAADAITLMRFLFRHFGDVSMSHHLTDDVVQAARRIESVSEKIGFSTAHTKPVGWFDVLRVGTNSGHGHAWARPDGMKARCGGPALCAQCARDQALAAERGDGNG